MTSNAALHIAEAVVNDGFAAHHDELSGLFDDARRRTVSDILVEVASDDSAPVPVRERALGRIVVAVSRPTTNEARFPRWVTSRIDAKRLVAA